LRNDETIEQTLVTLIKGPGIAPLITDALEAKVSSIEDRVDRATYDRENPSGAIFSFVKVIVPVGPST
jgi:hypothetical protein